MIRVLHYGMNRNLGGIETYLLNLARTIDSRRLHFDFLYSDLGQQPVFASDLPGSSFYPVTPRRTSPHRNREDLRRLFAEERFDILHFHAVSASYVQPVLEALRADVRVLVHSHGSGAASSLLTRTMHRWNQHILPWRRISKVAVSGEAGRWMFGSQPFEVIHNGIDVESFGFRPHLRSSTRDALGLDSESFVIGQVGALLPVKNHAFTLRAFRAVRNRRPDAMLLLVGAGPLEANLRREADELGVGEAVRFLGRRDDIPALLSAMDCLLLPSLHEGLPIVALEAQAAGLPCWLSSPVTSEVVLTPDCHRLPLDSPAVWAERILASSPEIDRSLGQQLLRHAGVSLQAGAERIQRIYLQGM